MAGTSEDEVGGLPAIPGLTLEEVRALISERIGLSVGRDDPVLAVYVLHEAFIREYEAMLARHNTALTALFEQSVSTWTDDVSLQISTFADQLLSQGLQDRMAQLGEHARVAAEMVVQTRRLVRWVSVLTALTGVGAAIAVLVLFLILR